MEDELGFSELRHKYPSENNKYFYHLGIIDYLQEFNLEKKGENFLKSIINSAGAQISAIDPKPYAVRYFKFMRDSVFVN